MDEVNFPGTYSCNYSTHLFPTYKSINKSIYLTRTFPKLFHICLPKPHLFVQSIMSRLNIFLLLSFSSLYSLTHPIFFFILFFSLLTSSQTTSENIQYQSLLSSIIRNLTAVCFLMFQPSLWQKGTFNSFFTHILGASSSNCFSPVFRLSYLCRPFIVQP